MSDYKDLLDELRSKWLFPCNIEAADLIERLIRERDEARAKAIDEALARCDMEIHNGPYPFDAARTEAHRRTAKAIRAAIAELKDKP